METKVYACYNLDETIREKSSSGGVFYVLMQWIIAQSGVVCGAKYDAHWEVVHDFAETLEDAEAFMTSKYVQSDTSLVFPKIRDYLAVGRWVLFSGTPCQVAGLQSYLGKAYEHLVTVDFICHGVPSRKVWREYVQLRSAGREIEQINFRDKTEGWSNYRLKMKRSDGSIYQNKPQDDLYMKGFLQDIYLRPSCYTCSFRGLHRSSDLTLADLWGCQEVCPALFDDKGTSLIFVHSPLGVRLWSSIAPQLNICPLGEDTYSKFNPSLYHSAKKTDKVASFQLKPTWENLQHLTRTSYKTKLRRFLGKCKRKLFGKRR